MRTRFASQVLSCKHSHANTVGGKQQAAPAALSKLRPGLVPVEATPALPAITAQANHNPGEAVFIHSKLNKGMSWQK